MNVTSARPVTSPRRLLSGSQPPSVSHMLVSEAPWLIPPFSLDETWVFSRLFCVFFLSPSLSKGGTGSELGTL